MSKSVRFMDKTQSSKFLSINLTLFDIETQNFKFRLITETVLDKSKRKKIEKKLFRARCFFDQAILQKLTGLPRHYINHKIQYSTVKF